MGLEFFTYELLFDNLNSAFANVKDANNFRLLVGLAQWYTLLGL